MTAISNPTHANKLRVGILTHGGAERIIELLTQVDSVEIAGVFVEQTTEKRRSFSEKIKRSIKYDGVVNTVQKFIFRLIGKKTGGENELETVERNRDSLRDCTARLGVPIFDVDNYHSHDAKRILQAANLDLGILFGTNIIKEDVFSIPRRGSINIHQGLAPFYRGGPTVFWELFNNETELGITVHFVAAKVDTGDILLQERFPLNYDFDRYRLDYSRFMDDFRTTLREPASQLVVEAVIQIAKGIEKPFRQDTTLGQRYRLPTKVEKDELIRRLKSRFDR